MTRSLISPTWIESLVWELERAGAADVRSGGIGTLAHRAGARLTVVRPFILRGFLVGVLLLRFSATGQLGQRGVHLGIALVALGVVVSVIAFFVIGVTIIGITVALTVGGSVIMETIFMLPGMGQFLIYSLTRWDYPVVQTLVLFFATWIVITNLLVDLSYGWLDPRVRFD